MNQEMLNQMKKDRASLENKEKKLARLKKHYSRYGERLVSTIMHYLMSENRTNQLLNLLGIKVRSRNEDDIHEAIKNWLNTYGEHRFFEKHRRYKIKRVLSDYRIEPLISEEPLDNYSQIDQKQNMAPAEVLPRETKSKVEEKEESPSHLEPESASAPPVIPIEIKAWPEIDRRNGVDRRKKSDRRDSIDVIFSNKRFGGERRAIKDRRSF
jgi:hypothetical protein